MGSGIVYLPRMENGGSRIAIFYPQSSILDSASRFLHVTYERFSLVNRNVRIGYERCQLVDHIAFGKSFVTPVPGHADLVNDLAVDLERLHPARDQSLGANLRARARDFTPVEILDAFLLGQFGTDLDEQLGLKLGEPWQPAA